MQLHGCLDLKRQSLTKHAPSVDFLVTAIVIRHRNRHFELSVAAHHHQNRGDELADGALLDAGDCHQEGPERHSKIAWTVCVFGSALSLTTIACAPPDDITMCRQSIKASFSS